MSGSDIAGKVHPFGLEFKVGRHGGLDDDDDDDNANEHKMDVSPTIIGLLTA
jgi:hypothetical protein